METDFILGAPKSQQMVTAAMKLRHLLLGRKAMTTLDSVLKSRHITLLTKVCLVKAMVLPVVMYGCQSWTIKKAEHWRTDAFELWCWRRLLRVPWTAWRSNSLSKGNQSWIFIGRIDAEAEAPILWPPDAKNWLIGKDPEDGKDWRKGEADDRGWGWMASLTQWRWVWAGSGNWWWTGKPGMLQSPGSQRLRHDCLQWVYFCFVNEFSCVIFQIPHVSDIVWYLSFPVW